MSSRACPCSHGPRASCARPFRFEQVYRAREAIDSQEAEKMAALNAAKAAADAAKAAATDAAKAAQDAASAATPPQTPSDANKGPEQPPKRD